MVVLFDVSDGRISYRKRKDLYLLGIMSPRKGEYIELVPGITLQVDKVTHHLPQKYSTIHLFAGCGLCPQTQEAFDKAGWVRTPAYEV